MTPPRRYLLIFLLSLLAAGCDGATAEYRTLAGESGRFGDHRGRWIVVNYWALWCKPCREEVSQLNLFAQKYRDKVTVFAVNFDGVQGARLREQVEQLDIRYPVLLDDPAPLLGLRRPRVLPLSWVLDPSGRAVAELQGPQDLRSLERVTGLSAAPPAELSPAPSTEAPPPSGNGAG